MPITATITISQGSDKTKFTITDATASEPNLTGRSIIIYKSDGTVYRQPLQVTDTIDFPYPATSIDILGLDKDLALSAVMTITSSAPVGGSVYSVTSKFALTGYTVTEQRERWKRIAENPRLENNVLYTNDLYRLLVEADNAVTAAAANDITSAQLALDRADKLIKYSKIPY